MNDAGPLTDPPTHRPTDPPTQRPTYPATQLPSYPPPYLSMYQVVPERAMAMLALTAFHDVMKVEALPP